MFCPVKPLTGAYSTHWTAKYRSAAIPSGILPIYCTVMVRVLHSFDQDTLLKLWSWKALKFEQAATGWTHSIIW